MCKIIFYKPAFKKKAMDAIVVFKKKKLPLHPQSRDCTLMN